MNPYINIALIAWTLLLAVLMFYNTVQILAEVESGPALIAGTLSFLSLFTALLAIGQYIN